MQALWFTPIVKHKKKGERKMPEVIHCHDIPVKGARCRILAVKRVIRKGVFWNNILTNSESSQIMHAIGKRLPKVHLIYLQ